ncbi:hypothetical protein ANN_01341 [Periplaneta americana]|uniref:Uncharacterized protein n=1 Tax=Periplaneta americana TaxID=6978 RepID=A0ABQ8TTB3_PERAM|nr:hypothetical protein ANN_01341 [Periplaneta americana]
MAGLCEGGNEPPGSLKAIFKTATDLRRRGMWSLVASGSAMYRWPCNELMTAYGTGLRDLVMPMRKELVSDSDVHNVQVNKVNLSPLSLKLTQDNKTVNENEAQEWASEGLGSRTSQSPVSVLQLYRYLESKFYNEDYCTMGLNIALRAVPVQFVAVARSATSVVFVSLCSVSFVILSRSVMPKIRLLMFQTTDPEARPGMWLCERRKDGISETKFVSVWLILDESTDSEIHLRLKNNFPRPYLLEISTVRDKITSQPNVSKVQRSFSSLCDKEFHCREVDTVKDDE